MLQHTSIPLLGIFLWVLSIHTGSFADAGILPQPITGINWIRRNSIYKDSNPISHVRISQKDLNQSVQFGSDVIDRLNRLETNLGWSQINVKKGTPSQGMLIAFDPDEEAMVQGKEAMIATKATIYLLNSFCYKYKIDYQNCAKLISKYKIQTTPLQSSCLRLKKTCTQEEYLSAYRSADGSCNHKSEGTRGQSFMSYKRLLHADYLDGIQELRISKQKKPLPSPRLISTKLLQKEEKYDQNFTLAVMQWSQFIEHDLSQTATSRMVHSGESIECCDTDGSHLRPRYLHPFCAPITIPSDDVYYSRHRLECMNYVRSLPALRSDCSFGHLEQINQATHYLDGSQLYGSTLKQTNDLRSNVNGQLEVSFRQDKTYLPMSHKPMDDCQIESDKQSCFKSGDSRVNLQPQLTVMHTLWHREHNRIASELSSINPHWDDETLFQEARRIVVAEMERITYHEWLPVILGKKQIAMLEKFNDYDSNLDPSVSNSFATAALRSFDSSINGNVKLFNENRLVNDTLGLQNHFYNPDIVKQPGYLDALVIGLATQSSKKVDMEYVEDIRNKLFSNGKYGYDILSLDIQRGRDHGLSSYLQYRTLCGLPDVKTFDEFIDVMSPETIESLSKVYRDPRDVDLIVGGLLETPDDDSLLGPTFSCIVADQFLRTRRGDRYFYQNNDQPKPFSKSQMKEIEEVTLARIFCDNSDNIMMMQPKVFQGISERNGLVKCESEYIPKLNLKLWLDTRETYYPQ